jgi:hypothetical protein
MMSGSNGLLRMPLILILVIQAERVYIVEKEGGFIKLIATVISSMYQEIN